MNYDQFENYNNDLVSAITKHMNIYEKKYPYVWYVNNINLRYAIEREMYFNFVTKIDYFYKLYINKQVDYSIKKYKSDILKLMIGEDIQLQEIKQINKDNFLNTKILKYKYKKPKILISIVSLKFLKYAETFINRIKIDFHLLCFDKNNELIKYIEEKGYRYTLFEAYYDESIFPMHLKGLVSSVLLQSLLNNVYNIMPSIILNFEGCHISDQILSEIGKLIKIKTICLQHGYAPFYPTTFRNFNYTKVLTWGEYFSEGFKPYSNDTKFIAVGNHIISTFLNTNKEVKVVSFFVQACKYYITKEYYDKFINLIIQIAKNNNTLKIIVREHPSNPIPEKYINILNIEKNIVFMNKQTHSITEVLEQSDLAISISSASLVEALEMNIIPIYINLPKLKMFERLKKKNPNIPMPKTIKSSVEIIQKLIDDKIHYNNIKKALFNSKTYLFKANGEEAIKNIIKEIR